MNPFDRLVDRRKRNDTNPYVKLVKFYFDIDKINKGELCVFISCSIVHRINGIFKMNRY